MSWFCRRGKDGCCYCSKTLDTFGQIDLLINNAGIAHIGLLSDMSSEEWHTLMGTNLDAVFYMSKAVIPHMVHRHSGKILNVSSVWGEVGASCEAAYSASKGAVNSLTKALAKELAPSHISVNGVSFGVIDTDMNRCFDEEERASLAEEIPTDDLPLRKKPPLSVTRLPNPQNILLGRLYALTVDGFDFELPQVRELCFC